MADVTWCTECLAELKGDGACLCGAVTAIPPGGPGEQPLIVGHLVLLDSAPKPAQILSESCVGARRFVGRGPFQTASWRHAGKTVWMWRSSLEHLPKMNRVADLSLWRLLSVSGALLIDVPEHSAYYAARYARNRKASRIIPYISELLDQLQNTLDLCGSSVRSAALFDPTNAADDAARAILSLGSSPPSCHTYPDAMKFLLPSARMNRVPISWPRPAAPARPQAGATGLLARAEAVPTEVKIITTDVGGSVTAHLLARLHFQTSSTAGRHGVADLMGGRLPIRGLVSEEGMAAAEHWESKQFIEPPPGVELPSWEGTYGHFWSAKGTISFRPLGSERPPDPSPTIIGVGPYRMFGEQDLLALVERAWSSKILPAAIITHDRCDQRLLDWVCQEFPGLPRYADSWEGNLAAAHEVLSKVLKWR